MSSAAAPPHVKAGSAIERLAKAIGYPDRIPEGAIAAVLRVDGAEIRAEETSGRVMLAMTLTENADLLPSLSAYAAGRILVEDAALAADPKTGEAFLWQDASATAGMHELLRLFETFMNSCDWWRDRVEALGGEEKATDIMEAVIRP